MRGLLHGRRYSLEDVREVAAVALLDVGDEARVVAVADGHLERVDYILESVDEEVGVIALAIADYDLGD